MRHVRMYVYTNIYIYIYIYTWKYRDSPGQGYTLHGVCVLYVLARQALHNPGQLLAKDHFGLRPSMAIRWAVRPPKPTRHKVSVPEPGYCAMEIDGLQDAERLDHLQGCAVHFPGWG